MIRADAKILLLKAELCLNFHELPVCQRSRNMRSIPRIQCSQEEQPF